MYIFRLSQLIVSRTSSIYISYGSSVNLSIHHVILSYDTFHRSLLLLIRFNLIYVTFIVTSIFVPIIFEALLRLSLHTKYLCIHSSTLQPLIDQMYFVWKTWAKYKHQKRTKLFLKINQIFEGKVYTVITVARLLFIWQANFANEFCMNKQYLTCFQFERQQQIFYMSGYDFCKFFSCSK